eukprot:3462031-Pyramimonas_sp.AAC.1
MGAWRAAGRARRHVLGAPACGGRRRAAACKALSRHLADAQDEEYSVLGRHAKARRRRQGRGGRGRWGPESGACQHVQDLKEEVSEGG